MCVQLTGCVYDPGYVEKPCVNVSRVRRYGEFTLQCSHPIWSWYRLQLGHDGGSLLRANYENRNQDEGQYAPYTMPIKCIQGIFLHILRTSTQVSSSYIVEYLIWLIKSYVVPVESITSMDTMVKETHITIPEHPILEWVSDWIWRPFWGQRTARAI